MAPPPSSSRPCSSPDMQSGLLLTNICDDETVFQRLLLVEGTTDNQNGSIQVLHDPKSGFKPQTWEVNLGHFKALVPLIIGTNSLTIIHQAGNTSLCDPITLKVTYVRPESLPLNLAIIAAKDSPVWSINSHSDSVHTAKESSYSVSRVLSKALNRLDLSSSKRPDTRFNDVSRTLVDSPPGTRRDRLHAGGIAEIKKRIAVQAYLWQAFHAEQMRRLGMGRRTFQLDDVDSVNPHNEATKNARELSLMPRIHLLRSKHNLKEFRDPDNAQQNSRARHGGAMHAFAQEALEDPSTPQVLHYSPVAVLTLDTFWDSNLRLLRAHGAVGSGGPGQISLGVMGSHWLWAAPSSLAEITHSFLDTEATPKCCVNDLNECPTSWQTLNIGSGAFFHEAGHAFNNPHWPSGVMARGYTEFNRAFMTREPGCPRNGKMRGEYYAPIHSKNDDKHFHLHRAQAVRARWHPSFRLPTDPPLPHLTLTERSSWTEWNENEPTWISTLNGAVLTSASGIGAVEIDFDGELRARLEWLDLPSANGESAAERPPTRLVLTPSKLSSLVGFDVMDPSSPSVKLNALACNMRQAEIDDYRLQGVARPVQIAGINPSRLIIKSIPFGSPASGHTQWNLIFPHERDDLHHIQPILRSIAIFSGACFDGLQFNYADGNRAIFGPCGGSPSIFNLHAGDTISYFKVRAGAWIDAIEVVLSSGRTSGMRGNTTGGSLRILRPHTQSATDTPATTGRGKVVGLYGSSGAWMDSIGIFTSSF